jgi:very-short-patch-repair endonuclease
MNPEIIIESFLVELKIPYEKEFKFHNIRKWRADYAIPSKMLLIEIEGAVFQKGRHTRGEGYSKDCEKYNAAQILGYKVLRYTTGQIKENPIQIYNDLREAIK